MKTIYAVYKGDEFQFHGTIEEIMEVTLLSRKSISSYGTPSYLKKTEGTNAIRIVKVGVL